LVSPGGRERKPAGNRQVGGERRRVLEDADEEICLEARRHGIVLARPLVWAVVFAGLGGVGLTLPSPVSVVGAGVVLFGAVIALRAVWRWDRTRVVVTKEKVFLLTGTWRRRAQSVRIRAVEAVELEQSLTGQLLGYGTVVVGPLSLDRVPRPKRLYRLLEQLSG
jgi:Bacterial PH domain